MNNLYLKKKIVDTMLYYIILELRISVNSQSRLVEKNLKVKLTRRINCRIF